MRKVFEKIIFYGDFMSEREKALREIFEGVEDAQKCIADKVIGEIVFLEEKLAELKQLPFIRVHPNNAAKQVATPACKLYKEFMQSYLNGVKVLEAIVRRAGIEKDDEFDEWLEEQQSQMK
mgnify:CR=1 FL=1